MGAYSPLPWLAERFGSEQAFVEEVTRDVALPVVRQLDAEGTPFIGLLYAGLILTPQGTGRPIEGLDEAAAVEGVRLVHAATASPDAPGGSLIATGGRVLNVVAVAPDFRTARDRAYDALGRIRLEGSHHRTDIAARVAD
ncbi:unnamed protein product [Penicillium discolor]